MPIWFGGCSKVSCSCHNFRVSSGSMFMNDEDLWWLWASLFVVESSTVGRACKNRVGLQRVQVHPTLSFSNIGNDAVINHHVLNSWIPREVGKYGSCQRNHGWQHDIGRYDHIANGSLNATCKCKPTIWGWLKSHHIPAIKMAHLWWWLGDGLCRVNPFFFINPSRWDAHRDISVGWAVFMAPVLVHWILVKIKIPGENG